MLTYKDIKQKDENLDQTFHELLNIKNPNIYFSTHAYQKEHVNGRLTNVYPFLYASSL